MSGVTFSVVLLLGILVVATIVFATEKIPADVVALVLLLLMVFLGYVTPSEAFSGFSSDAIVILISAFVFTGALTRSGVSHRIGQRLVSLAAGRRGVLRAAILLASATLSLVINNVAAAAVLLPGVVDALRRRHIPPSKVLLPLSYATLLGGMATLLTTSNIVAGEVLRQKGFRPFGLTDFFPVGGPLALIGILYLFFAAPRLLPDRSPTEHRLKEATTNRSLERIYELRRRLQSVRILPHSELVGSLLGESGLAPLLGASVIAIAHPDGTQRRAPEPTQKLAAGDLLILDGLPREPEILSAVGLELVRIKKPTRYLVSPRVALMEGIIGPRSSYPGKTLRELSFRETHGGISVLSIFRAGGFLEGEIADVNLEVGDALLMQGPRTSFRSLRSEDELVLIGEEDIAETPNVEKTSHAILILIATLVAAVIFSSNTALVLFTGAVAMLLSRCLTTREAYRAVDWRSVVLIAGMLPLSIALSHSGAAELISRFLIGGSANPETLLAIFTLVTVALTQVLPGGAATPLVMVPIAISAATSVGADPRAFAMAIALATGTKMLTPFSHPVNLIVMGPGGYRFRDYGRVGFPLLVLTTAGIIVLVSVMML